MEYNALIFEGGGMKGMCYVGAIEELTQDNFLDLSKIHHFGGTSAGAIIATLLASNHTLDEIQDVMYKTKWKRMQDGNFGFFRNTIRLFRRFGYHRGLFMEKLMNKLLMKKTGIKRVTFEQLYGFTGNHLKMVGTNVTTGEVVYMDHICTPHMAVAKAVQISSCIPFMFKPVTYNRCLYVDGGLIKNLDLNMFLEFNPRILAFEIQNKNNNEEIDNMMTYFMKLFEIIHKEANLYNQSELIDTNILKIYENELSPFKFDMKRTDLSHLKQVGTSYAKKFKSESIQYQL